jgi:hypothetical protein
LKVAVLFLTVQFLLELIVNCLSRLTEFYLNFFV